MFDVFDSDSYFNPYAGKTFLEFFGVLFTRFFAFLKGDLPLEKLSSDEVQIVVLFFIAASSALVGVFLVLRKMAMLANSLSHTILLGIMAVYSLSSLNGGNVLAALDFKSMLIAAILTGFLTSFLTELLSKSTRLQEDASTGIIFTTLFAIGVIWVTVASKSAHVGTEVVMGNVDSLNLSDCSTAFMIFILNALLLYVFYNGYLMTTFDPQLAKTLGYSTIFYNYLLMAEASFTVVGAFRAVGVLMVLAFITGPVLTARLLTDRLKILLGLAFFLAVLAAITGVALSRHILTVFNTPLSTSGLVVIVIILQFTVAACYKLLRASLKKSRDIRQLREVV